MEHLCQLVKSSLQSMPTPWYIIHPQIMTLIFLLVPGEIQSGSKDSSLLLWHFWHGCYFEFTVCSEFTLDLDKVSHEMKLKNIINKRWKLIFFFHIYVYIHVLMRVLSAYYGYINIISTLMYYPSPTVFNNEHQCSYTCRFQYSLTVRWTISNNVVQKSNVTHAPGAHV